jgi:hypothetical protein
LVIKAQDAFEYIIKFGGFYYDALVMVSNQDFDINALNYANELDVLCLLFDKGQLIEKNAPMNWVGNPAWMKQKINFQAFRT